MSNYLNIGQSWGQQRVEAIRQSYESKGLKASGQFGNSLKLDVTEDIGKLNIKISGAPQVGIMQLGRKPNTKQTPEQLKAWVGWAGSTIIREWVRNKRLSINPFAVAWKIARQGIKVPNKFNQGTMLQDALTAESIADLIKQLGSASIESLKSQYIKSWQ